MKTKNTIFQLTDIIDIELISSNSEFAEEYIAEEGFDIKMETSKVQNTIKRLKFTALAHNNKERDEALLIKVLDKVRQLINTASNLTSNQLLNTLRTQAPQVQFRKLEEWSDDEIKDVLIDVNLVNLLEDLSNIEEG